MLGNLPKDLILWKHQEDAINSVIRHFNESKNNEKKSFLIRMPTGTGKTGVIATLSLYIIPGSVLIITPWRKLRTQMKNDIKTKFWEKINHQLPKENIVEFVPSKISKYLCSNNSVQIPKVFICTFSTLVILYRKNKEIYDKLSAHINAVIIDEGHYEPALNWGRAVKELRKKTILLTATPYRNDLKLFRIENIKKQVFNYSHKEAEDNNILRKVSFLDLNFEKYIDDFINKWNELNKSNNDKKYKAIICCESFTDIKTVYYKLFNKGIDVAGIHENFRKDIDKKLFKNVPDDFSLADVWIHQNKLTEGIDNSDFLMVVFFYNISNDRKLVQQIGRVLRLDSGDEKMAIVLSPSKYNIKERWDNYLSFETDFKLVTQDHYRKLIEYMIKKQPEIEYFNGGFNKRLDLNDLKNGKCILIPPTILIRKINKSFNNKKYVEECTDNLNLNDAIILGNKNNPCLKNNNFILWVYATIKNSNLLIGRSFYEIKLNTHCFFMYGNYLVVSDSSGIYPNDFLEKNTEFLDVDKFTSLIDNDYRVTSVSINNTIPFDSVIKSSKQNFLNLNKITTSFVDRMHICKAIRGVDKAHRRYLGIDNGRIRDEFSDKKLKEHSSDAFIEWATSIVDSLSECKKVKNESLNRYMKSFTIGSYIPIPELVYMDLSNLFIISEYPNRKISYINNNFSITDKKDNKYKLEIEFKYHDDDFNGEEKKGRVYLQLFYQKEKKRFWCKYYKKNNDEQLIIEGSGKSIAEFMNSNQDLLLITSCYNKEIKNKSEKEICFYQARNFYKIDYDYINESMVNLIIHEEKLRSYSEKGVNTKDKVEYKKNINDFLDDTLFALIAKEKISSLFKPELIICDDLGTECSDFIYANFTTQSLAFIHAKSSEGYSISCSAFHDLISQAMKNLVYFTRNKDIPKKVTGSWNHDSHWNGTNIKKLYKMNEKTNNVIENKIECKIKGEKRNECYGKELWSKIKNELIYNSEANLYIFLVTTGCMKYKDLIESISKKEKRMPETAQLLYLLDGFINYAGQLGVKVKLIDIPFYDKK